MLPKPKETNSFHIFDHLPHTEMLYVEGTNGTPFQMGDEIGDMLDDSRPVHPVQLSDFHIGQYLVTNALWAAVMGSPNPHSVFTGDFHPVEHVSWDDICQPDGFLDRLNKLPHIAKRNATDGKQFRLPTEAQWEYAARGGPHRSAHHYKYAGGNHLKEVGWYDANSPHEPKAVGLKKPNALGLYDMSGNLYEWCADIWGSYTDEPKNGDIPNTNGDADIRVVRGGSWFSYVRSCRVSFRNWDDTDYRGYIVGFRLSWY